MLSRLAIGAALALAGLAAAVGPAQAFCGFYVAKADTELFNEASKVVIARHGAKTVITMVNDYQGEPQEFALVIPVPSVLAREQIHVTDKAVVEHLDAYTAPRLVEYFDPDPCRPQVLLELLSDAAPQSVATPAIAPAAALGVTIEARYTVGEYDILILSAEQSDGLQAWLVQSGYRLPEGVIPVLDAYIAAGMKFFVARIDLEARARLGATYLRPLQIAFESPHFMLPIRLGMVNAAGPQELFVMTLTRGGRVETRNYRTVPMPSDLQVPIFVKEEFGDFYAAMFAQEVEKQDRRAVFLEYAWDMAWCDPCAADPLSLAELRELGVFWLDGRAGGADAQSRARDVFVTRLHLRYDAEHFPDDLMFAETSSRENFQGRYVLRHPWRGPARCAAGAAYFTSLSERYEREAQRLANLTGWPIAEIRDKMAKNGQRPPAPDDEEWWHRLWPKG
ncbi:MAG: DUF2330 domain-containing protein [Kiloniellales bacterium]